MAVAVVLAARLRAAGDPCECQIAAGYRRLPQFLGSSFAGAWYNDNIVLVAGVGIKDGGILGCHCSLWQ